MFYDIGPINQLHNVTILFGGRGVGKTYSTLRHLVLEDHKFIWLRDTERVVDTIVAGSSLTAPIEADDPYFPHVEIVKEKNLGKFYKVKPGSDKTSDGDCIGYLCALSTFRNLRGIDFSDVDIIVIDEFIPEEGAMVREHVGTTFLNMYETVNRNRELKGADPVKIILLSNTNNIYSDILVKLGVNRIIENMIVSKEKIYTSKDLHIEFISDSEFTKAKSQTLIYRLSNDEKFKQNALKNEFSESRARIKKVSLKGYKAICQVNQEYVILLNKNDNLIYIKEGNYKNLQNYDMADSQQALLFRFLFSDHLRTYYVIGNMFFDSIYTQHAILEYAKIN